MGIPDPMGVLREGEVFIQVVQVTDHARKVVTVLGETLVYRNPCLHPGDVRKVLAVDHAALRHLVDVVVFATQGTISLAACLSGGDLDGDKYACVWDARLVSLIRTVPPLNYDRIAKEAKQHAPPPPQPDMYHPQLQHQVFSQNQLADFFCRIVENDTLGKIAHLHLALCDVQTQGALDPLASALAEAQSVAVDFPKTGLEISLSLFLSRFYQISII
jgi:hypothetical protein